MDSRELRLGNIIDKKFDGGDFQWSFFRKEEFDEIEKYPNLFRYTTLTEDWLLKFGFKKFDGNTALKEEFKKPNNWQYYHDKYNYHYDNGLMFLDSGNDEGWNVKKNIKYVHELQNLHHTLTGEELQ